MQRLTLPRYACKCGEAGLGLHLLSDQDGASRGAAFLAAAALTHRAVSAGSEHFYPFKGAS